MQKIHVLLIYRRMIPSIRLCGHCQLEVLAERGEIEYRAVQELALKNADLRWADCVVLGRLDSQHEAKLAAWLKKAGKHLMYIIDDDLLNVPAEFSSAVHYSNPEIKANIRAMIGMSDVIVSPSPLLLEKYAGPGVARVRLEEPALSPAPFQPHDPASPIKIGFAGSIDRTGDVESILRETLFAIRDKYGDKVEFCFFGAIPSFAKELGATCIPYCESYDQYREKLNSLGWDIGLAPMPDTPFHACKHYNKFVEYSAAGILGIYSDVMPYTRMRNDVEIGVMLCSNRPRFWIDALCRWIDDRAALEYLRKDAADYVIHRLQPQHTVEPLLDHLRTLSPAPKYAGRYPFLLGKLSDIFQRGLIFLKKYGLKAPVTLVRKALERRGA